MLTFEIGSLVELVSMLSHLRQAASSTDFSVGSIIENPEDLHEEMMVFSNHLRDCGLPVTAESLDAIIVGIVAGQPITALASDVHIFNRTLVREFKAKAVLMSPMTSLSTTVIRQNYLETRYVTRFHQPLPILKRPENVWLFRAGPLAFFTLCVLWKWV